MTLEQRRESQGMERAALERRQLERLNALLGRILPRNRFYQEKLAGLALPLRSLDELPSLPFTYKDELQSAGHGSLAANLTYPLDHYVRFHRTSGTRGKPLAVLDTADDWQWWLETWQYVLDAAELTPADRVLTAFSFGPFIGFWTAHEAAVRRGALVIPGGGLSTLARLDLMHEQRPTVLFCTPSYARHLAQVAAENKIDTRSLGVTRIVVAGEPGGSIPAVRQQLSTVWNARLIDHAGATEIGPWGFADSAGRGLHVIESEFVAEFLSLETGRPAGEAELAELVLTTLGRDGCPVIRYRTGDLVRPTRNAGGEIRFVLLDGGVLGRTDDMLIIRGVNIFPTAIEQIVRSFPEVLEFRLIARRSGAMDLLSVEVEDRLNSPDRIAHDLRLRLGLKIDVHSVPPGSLPRSDSKAQRFLDLRPKCFDQPPTEPPR